MVDFPATVLETERLILVPLDMSRAEELASIYSDADVARYIGGDLLTAERTRDQVAAFERVWRAHGYGQSALVSGTTGGLIGRAGLHPWPAWDELELGFVLARDQWGRGLAGEAAHVWLNWVWTHLTLDHLIAVIQPANTSSIALAERLGFGFDRPDVTPRGDPVWIYRIDRPGHAPE